jgi:outer membrane lipoprotein-sorting protein
MNRDKRIHQLLNDYAEKPSEGLRERVQDRLAEQKRNSRRAVYRRWSFAGACAAALTVAFLLTAPKVAVANKLREVHGALSTAKSMRFTLIKESGGAERPVYWVWKEGDKWRRRKSYSPENDVTCVVNDGKKWTYVARDQTATEEPYRPGEPDSEFDADVDALEVAKKMTSPDETPGDDVRVESHASVGGRETFAIVSESRDGRVRSEMVVDERTRLPLSLTMDVISKQAGAPAVRSRGIWQFAFNENLDPSLFEPVFGPEVKIVVSPSNRKPVSEVVSKSMPGVFSTMDGTPCEPTILYRIRFGDRDNEIGVVQRNGSREGLDETAGFAGFAVRSGGSLIIADRVNGRVKEFDIHGNLVMVTKETVEEPRAVAPGPAGTTYATSGRLSDTLSKFDRDGKLLWRTSASEVLPANLGIPAHFGDLSVADDGSVGLTLDQEGWILILNGEGLFQSIRIAHSILPDGRFVTFAPASDGQAAIDSVTIDASGGIVSKVRLAPIASNGEERTADWANDYADPVPDAQGNWYRVWLQRRTKRLDIGDSLRIRSEAVVAKYAPDGTPLAQGVVDATPFGYPQSIAPSPDGYLYSLAYGTDRVFVIRYRLP